MLKLRKPKIIYLVVLNCNNFVLQCCNTTKRCTWNGNNVKPDQTAPELIWVCTICLNLCLPVLGTKVPSTGKYRFKSTSVWTSYVFESMCTAHIQTGC